MKPSDIRRALRKARKLDASMVPADYREAWRLQGAIIKAAQRRPSWEGGAFAVASAGRRAEYLARMAAARRAGDKAAWMDHRQGLNIWRGSSPFLGLYGSNL